MECVHDLEGADKWKAISYPSAGSLAQCRHCAKHFFVSLKYETVTNDPLEFITTPLSDSALAMVLLYEM